MANAFDRFDPAPNAFDQFDPQPVSTADRAQAAAAGVNRGALVNLAGLPVATALNVWDLAKAGTGAVMGAFGAKPENLPELTDRSKVVGSPEWIAQQIEQRGAGAAINPNRPDDTASRYLHAGGQGVAAGMVAPQTLPHALASATMGGASMLAGQTAAEHGAGPAGQILAASALPLATAAAARGAQTAIDTGRRTAAQRAATDATIREAQDAGYAFPPAQVNPSLVNKVLGGVSGKAATEQAASLANQPVTNRLARNALGLADDAPLSVEALNAIRRQAGADYEAVRNFGTIHADDGYLRSLIGLQNRYQQRIGAGGGSQPMESLRIPQVERLLGDVARPDFSSTSAIELIRRFRSDADGNFHTGNRELAHYQKGVANALEDLVGNNLAAADQPELLANFQAARQRIAQSYDVEKALNPATGNVDARKLAAAQRGGRPLSGELLTAARAGGYAPLATREYQQTPPGISALDVGIGTVGGAAAALGAGPAALAPVALPAARLAARKAILSGPYQNLMGRPPTGEPSALARSLAAADVGESAFLAPTLSLDDIRREALTRQRAISRALRMSGAQ